MIKLFYMYIESIMLCYYVNVYYAENLLKIRGCFEFFFQIVFVTNSIIYSNIITINSDTI